DGCNYFIKWTISLTLTRNREKVQQFVCIFQKGIMGVIRMRVLIAEDELIERKAMRKFIEDNFSDIVVVGEAANGRNASEQAPILEPDVLFMDINMPCIDGLEAIERIHANDPSIKFIMISAYDSFAYAKKAMRFGIKDYILKPGKKEEVAKALLR